MNEQAAPAVGAVEPSAAKTTTGRTIALTLGAVVIVAAAGLGAFLAFHHEQGRAQKYRRQAASLRVQVDGLQSQLASARSHAVSSFTRGMIAGENIDKKIGNTYPKGYADGWNAAFAGFDGWIVGSWYLVKIGRDSHGRFEMTNRSLMTPCQRTFIENDAIYTQGSAC